MYVVILQIVIKIKGENFICNIISTNTLKINIQLMRLSTFAMCLLLHEKNITSSNYTYKLETNYRLF